MRTNVILSAAVAGLLASAAASAANVDLYISGSSALRNFFKANMVTTVCGANAQTTYSIAGPSNAPDNQAYRCLAGAATLPSGISAGDQVTLHYSAEFGSISGIAIFLPGHNTTRLFVNPDSADCVGGTCTIATYSGQTETFTSTNGTALVSHVPDAGVSDMEATDFSISDNWLDSTYTWWNPVPTFAQTATFQSASKVMNGQIFTVIVNNANPVAAKGNLSKASLSAIFTGQYSTWGQVPEVGGGNTTPIKVCRRDHGSGTQVAASVFFAGTECGTGSSPFVSATNLGALTSVEEQNTTGKLTTCVSGTAGAIGFRSFGTGSFTTITVDGVQANAHNAAAAIYPYAFEDYIFDNTTASGASTAAKNFYNLLFSNARKAANLPAAETGSLMANGQWTTTAPALVYALPGGGFGNNAFKNATSWQTTTQAVTALGYRSGNNCNRQLNTNAP